MSLIKLALGAYELAKAAGGAAAAVQLGEVVLTRTGVLKKDTKIIPETARFVLDVAGVPDKLPPLPFGLGVREPTALPPAPEPVPALPHVGSAIAADTGVLCVDCVTRSDAPITISGTESMLLGQCAEHAAEAAATAERVGALYDGWRNAWGLGDATKDYCGARPQLSDAKYTRTKSLQVGNKQIVSKYQNTAAYYKDLSDWQTCAQKVKDDAAATKKALADAKSASAQAQKAAKKAETQKKLADFALKGKQGAYEKQIAELKAQFASEQDAAKQAALQAKIDEAEKGRALAEQMAAELRATQQDQKMAEMQASLTAAIADKAQQPGGMDQFMQMLMLQMMQPQAPPAQPFMASPEMSMPAPVIPWAPSPEAYEQGFDPNAGAGFPDQFDPMMSFAGAGDDEPLDPDLADALPYLSGVRDQGMARMLHGLAQTGEYEDDDLVDLAAALNSADENGLSGCAIGACGLR